MAALSKAFIFPRSITYIDNVRLTDVSISEAFGSPVRKTSQVEQRKVQTSMLMVLRSYTARRITYMVRNVYQVHGKVGTKITPTRHIFRTMHLCTEYRMKHNNITHYDPHIQGWSL